MEVSFVLQAAALKYGMCYLDQPGYAWFFRPSGWTFQQNCQLRHSIDYCVNYYRLMRSKTFRDLFSEVFTTRWIWANIGNVTRTFGGMMVGKIMRDALSSQAAA
jgi:hypothetical protein